MTHEDRQTSYGDNPCAEIPTPPLAPDPERFARERMGTWPVQPSPSPAEILREAERRYLYDAEFHARANLTSSILGLSTPQQMLDGHDTSLARHAACVALILAEIR